MPRLRTVVGGLLPAALMAGVLAGIRLYVFPRTERAAPTDVIYIIGPATDSHVRVAERLLGAGLSENLMVSFPEAGRRTAAMDALLEGEHPYRVFVSQPEPFTTRGEARWLAGLAAEHGWTSATVITFTPHIFRARVLLRRSFTGELRMVADTEPQRLNWWLYQFLYQTAAFAKVVLRPSP